MTDDTISEERRRRIAAYCKQYEADHKRQIAANRRRRYHANLEDNRAKCRAKAQNRKAKQVEYKRRYRALNKDRLNVQARALRVKNRDAYNAKRRSWAKAHRAKATEYVKRWRAKNPGVMAIHAKNWRDRHPDRLRVTTSLTRVRRRTRSSGDHYTTADVVSIMAKQRGKCAYCKCHIRLSYHIDHIIPLSKGGSNWPANIQLTCPQCNLRKHDHDPIDFARSLGMLL